jgi:hypothetical protein
MAIDEDDVTRYRILQAVLWAIHYGVAFAVVGIAATDDCSSFKTGFNFRYNVWGTNMSGSCSAGCTLSAETFTFPKKLNVNVLVAFFSIVSGTNHFIQAVYVDSSWFEQGYFSIRSLDFGVSAGLMVIANSILFYAPPDVLTMTLWFAFQALTQLGGYAAEVLLSKDDAEREAFNVYCVAGILYLVPWSLLFATFAMTAQDGYLDPEIATNEPPLQVWFFLAWIFQTFMLFPLALFFKIRALSSFVASDAKSGLQKPEREDVCYKFEVVYSLLSFVAKLPLLAVFAGGSFQRGLFTDLEGDTGTDGCPAAGEQSDSDTYLLLFGPMGASIIGAIAVVYLFSDRLFNNDWYSAGETVGKSFVGLTVITLYVLMPALLSFAVEDPTAILYVALVVPAAFMTALWQAFRAFL